MTEPETVSDVVESLVEKTALSIFSDSLLEIAVAQTRDADKALDLVLQLKGLMSGCKNFAEMKTILDNLETASRLKVNDGTGANGNEEKIQKMSDEKGEEKKSSTIQVHTDTTNGGEIITQGKTETKSATSEANPEGDLSQFSKDLFVCIDVRKRGRISKTELLLSIRKIEVRKLLESNPKTSALARPALWFTCFNNMDTDKDGFVTFSEFESFVMDKDSRRTEQVDAFFAALLEEEDNNVSDFKLDFSMGNQLKDISDMHFSFGLLSKTDMSPLPKRNGELSSPSGIPEDDLDIEMDFFGDYKDSQGEQSKEEKERINYEPSHVLLGPNRHFLDSIKDMEYELEEDHDDFENALSMIASKFEESANASKLQPSKMSARHFILIKRLSNFIRANGDAATGSSSMDAKSAFDSIDLSQRKLSLLNAKECQVAMKAIGLNLPVDKITSIITLFAPEAANDKSLMMINQPNFIQFAEALHNAVSSKSDGTGTNKRKSRFSVGALKKMSSLAGVARRVVTLKSIFSKNQTILIRRIINKMKTRRNLFGSTSKSKVEGTYSHDPVAIFSALDKQGTKEIPSRVFIGALKKIGVGLREDQFNELIKAIDEDGNGKISEAEFMAVFKLLKEGSESENKKKKVPRKNRRKKQPKTNNSYLKTHHNKPHAPQFPMGVAARPNQMNGARVLVNPSQQQQKGRSQPQKTKFTKQQMRLIHGIIKALNGIIISSAMSLPPAQFDNLKHQVFMNVDKEQSGVLSADSFCRALAMLGARMFKVQVDNVFKCISEVGNDGISEVEFLAVCDGLCNIMAMMHAQRQQQMMMMQQQQQKPRPPKNENKHRRPRR